MAVTLWCTTCHTKWTEQCYNAGGRCPLKGCVGELTLKAPAGAKPAARATKEPTSYPILDVAQGRHSNG